MRVAIVGGGIFGVTTALALRDRRCDVTLFDPGLPHPLAESTDLSKVVRLDYGTDEDYTALAEAALVRWRTWPTFHETGVTFLARAPMQPGGFEHDSFATLVRRGHPLERLDATAISARFPAYRPGALVDGYFNPAGGWAAASATVSMLAGEAVRRGVVIEARRVAALDELAADLVVACGGAWVPRLLPELAPFVRAVGQPVFHLRPDDPALFEAHRFPVFGADIARTGYYGFPLTDGVVKIANHGTGVATTADAPRDVSTDQEAALRAMLADTFPALANAPIVQRRLCVYGDTTDGNFWIDRHPTRPNVVVATGGSGHAFKFAPVLGDVIASIALGEPQPLAAKFRWRPDAVSSREAARHIS